MTKPVRISEELHAKIAEHCEKTGQTIEACVEHAVTAALEGAGAPVYKTHDEEAIKERLKSLGYID
jgi:hypothetical protein